jgi:hypothetical protein
MKNLFSKSILLSGFFVLLTGMFLFIGCEREDDELLDDVILNLSELKEHII